MLDLKTQIDALEKMLAFHLHHADEVAASKVSEELQSLKARFTAIEESAKNAVTAVEAEVKDAVEKVVEKVKKPKKKVDVPADPPADNTQST